MQNHLSLSEWTQDDVYKRKRKEIPPKLAAVFVPYTLMTALHSAVKPITNRVRLSDGVGVRRLRFWERP